MCCAHASPDRRDQGGSLHKMCNVMAASVSPSHSQEVNPREKSFEAAAREELRHDLLALAKLAGLARACAHDMCDVRSR